MKPTRRLLSVGAAALVVLLAACGGRGEETEPAPPPPPPDLTGERVMVLPVRAPAPGQLDAELAFWLGDRSPSTDWVGPAALQAAADRSPAWRMRLDALRRPVVDVGGGELRVPDPLYGALRRLGAVVSSDYALVPLEAGQSSDSTGVEVGLGVAVVDIRGGRVLWMHTFTSGRNATLRAAVATLAETVARTLFP